MAWTQGGRRSDLLRKVDKSGMITQLEHLSNGLRKFLTEVHVFV